MENRNIDELNLFNIIVSFVDDFITLVNIRKCNKFLKNITDIYYEKLFIQYTFTTDYIFKMCNYKEIEKKQIVVIFYNFNPRVQIFNFQNRIFADFFTFLPIQNSQKIDKTKHLCIDLFLFDRNIQENINYDENNKDKLEYYFAVVSYGNCSEINNVDQNIQIHDEIISNKMNINYHHIDSLKENKNFYITRKDIWNRKPFEIKTNDEINFDQNYFQIK